MNILLDYFFPITSIEPTPAASTAFLKQALAIVKPKEGAVEDTITLCTSKSAVDAFTVTNTEVDQLFDAGMSRVYVLAVDDLTEIGDILVGHESDFFTILVSSDFSDSEMDAGVFGAFKGVIAMASTDDAKNETRAGIANRSAWHSTSTNKAKNMFYAFGKLLSNAASWRNQQYISMPLADDVDTLGEATNLFDDKISFVLDDSEFGTRLGLFAVGGKAIVAPYIKRNLELDLQSAALSYVSGNQPEYTKTQAALLEDELQKVIQEDYVDQGLIEAGTVSVTLVQDNFVANGAINIAEPKALWRIVGEIRQTL
jgi:hypothetical protein